jgi:hypothetical protein
MENGKVPKSRKQWNACPTHVVSVNNIREISKFRTSFKFQFPPKKYHDTELMPQRHMYTTNYA